MKPGIYPNLPRDEYDKIDAVNASLLKQAARSMAHAKAYKDGHRRTSASLAFGKAYHAYVLERQRFDKDYKIIPKVNRSTKEGKQAWASAVEAAGSEDLVVWSEDVATFEAMRCALHAENRRRTICTCPGEYEVCVVWECDGQLCKALIDKLCPEYDIALDLKKAEDARDFAFVSAMIRYDYCLQAAFYMDGLATITKKPHGFCFLAQEAEPPFASKMFEIVWEDRVHLAHRERYRELMAMVWQCGQRKVWPGYGDDVVSVAEYAMDKKMKWLITEQGA